MSRILILKKLASLADELDEAGFTSLAQDVDSILLDEEKAQSHEEFVSKPSYTDYGTGMSPERQKYKKPGPVDPAANQQQFRDEVKDVMNKGMSVEPDVENEMTHENKPFKRTKYDEAANLEQFKREVPKPTIPNKKSPAQDRTFEKNQEVANTIRDLHGKMGRLKRLFVPLPMGAVSGTVVQKALKDLGITGYKSWGEVRDQLGNRHQILDEVLNRGPNIPLLD